MSSVELRKVDKHYAGYHALKTVDLTIEKGEFVVMVGPSGCGKSTLLKTIAGLETINSGHIVINGRDVTREEPGDRGIAMVFQSYALYPHMTVAENMGFGLRMANRPRTEIDAAVKRAARILRLEEQLDKRPKQLSGGQRQRVAIGRAVVREPKLFLFDEPLSNLDAALRVNTRLEIAQLHRRLKATMIYVTHDQVEAMTLADKIVVLNAGRIEQIGSPMELYNAPANEFVAGFIGSPKMNFIDGAKLGETAKTVGVRPEHLTVDAKSGAWKGTVVHAEHLGADTNLYLDCEKAGLLTVRIFGVYNAEPGATLYATPDPAKTYRFGADGRVLK
ncbi:MAG: ABC transporter ATP-binding protein [Mesorhizobium sp.]|uniref:ABC transporter ATP-binding protein n=1 Tax=Mesorhizobium sp. TaxID=1871066 RepID=UPI000FE5509D|nr:ABC transporter ATP-binding protein [Mesorhizobium sp.]RWH07553.1 MAG: ABC transporter ATP-binding protein [Mesorhizobium sp.]